MLIISLFQQSLDQISQGLIYADSAVLQHQCLYLLCALLLFLVYLLFSSISAQYLLEAGWAAEGKVIGVTQPRRVAAISVRALLIVLLFLRANVISLQENLFMLKDMPVSNAMISPLFTLMIGSQPCCRGAGGPART